ncbi:MAG: nucleotidyltransferase substrate binding protein [Ignavibacteria bacterium]|jgi:nucleotidyltransferase substrate binding protein (TIGR01987 family)|nr:nucleotidyltransferase substrate binding protein [Ignavibacteria bacterium]
MDNNDNDVRWKQRFQNFESTLKHLKEALDIKDPDIIQRAGMIQFFEMSFELSWNMIKDYLEEQGFTDVKSPRESIKNAFETGLITDGHGWLKMMEDRNLTSHAYEEETAKEIEKVIRNNHYKLLKELQSEFTQK